MPDSFFDGLAAAQPPSIRGIVNRGPVVVPNPGDPTQSISSTRVARFGWKAGVPTLMQFSADAYVNEMAHHDAELLPRRVAQRVRASNRRPTASPCLDGCDDLAPRQTGANPGGLTATQWAQVDDAVGSCAGNRTEIQDDVFLFAVFMTALAPAPRDFSDQIAVSRGQPLFTQIGCNGCHVTTTFRTPANPAPIDIEQRRGDASACRATSPFNPYSDFLVHDMGSLGDQIGNAGDSVAVRGAMRTAPLWGIRFRTSCCTTAAAATSRARSAPTTARRRRRATRSTR